LINRVNIRIPATSANCGPGFDCLGLACSFYNEVSYEITETGGFQLEVEGEGADYLMAFGKNLAFSSFFHLWNQVTNGTRIGLKVKMINRIPMARGLGSSSATIVGGLMGASVLSGKNLSKEELLKHANILEGHPDNVAPAIYGNFTVSFQDEEGAHSLVLKPAKPLKFIAVVPDMQLKTSVARQAIPKHVPHVDAVFNASRSALLVGSLLSGDYTSLGKALEDRLHQNYRAHLIPGLEEMFEVARQKGAYNGIISGAGSTVMAYTDPDSDLDGIGRAMTDVFNAHNIVSRYYIFDMDKQGAEVLE